MKKFQDLKKVSAQKSEEVQIPVLRMFEHLPDPREQYQQDDAPATRVLETI